MENLIAQVESFMDTFNTRDFSKTLDFFTDASVYVDPFGVQHSGRAAIAQALAPSDEFLNASTKYDITSTSIDEHTSTATVTWTLVITSDGNTSAIDGLDILRFREGKIAVKNAFCKAREISTRTI